MALEKKQTLQVDIRENMQNWEEDWVKVLGSVDDEILEIPEEYEQGESANPDEMDVDDTDDSMADDF